MCSIYVCVCVCECILYHQNREKTHKRQEKKNNIYTTLQYLISITYTLTFYTRTHLFIHLIQRIISSFLCDVFHACIVCKCILLCIMLSTSSILLQIISLSFGPTQLFNIAFTFPNTVMWKESMNCVYDFRWPNFEAGLKIGSINLFGTYSNHVFFK